MRGHKCTSISASSLLPNDGISTAEIIGGDVFFEIVDPLELEYTYRLRPAKDFGAAFVCYENTFLQKSLIALFFKEFIIPFKEYTISACLS